MKDVTFILPAYNEEKSIGNLLTNIKQLYPDSRILVVDNNSQDSTPEIAKKAGADVIYEKIQGKGHAVRKAFENVNSKFVVMLDADYTYDPEDAELLLKPLIEDKADVVLGSRLNNKMEDGAISQFNLLGNYILSFVTSLLYSRISDVCTGYWTFRKEIIDYLLNEKIDSDGFELEVEMFIKIFKGEFRICELPIKYRNRIDKPKLHSTKDGWKIFRTLWVYKFKS